MRGSGLTGQGANDVFQVRQGSPEGGTDLPYVLEHNHYIGFTVTPGAGMLLHLDGAEFRFAVSRQNNNAATLYSVFSSVDGFSLGAEIGTEEHPGPATDLITMSYSFNGSQFNHLTGPLEIRIYPHNSTWGRNLSFRDFALFNGTIAPEGEGPPPPAAYTVRFTAGTGGSLSGEVHQTVNRGEATSEVTAIPDAGYVFVHWAWTGGGSTATNPLLIPNVSEDLTVTAFFEEEPGPLPDPAQPENPGGGTGTLYYLDVNTGSDSNSGLSEGTAWQTFQHAINTLQPGDTVLIREGDYFSSGNDAFKNWDITTSGTPGQYITYRAYPGERPRFHVDTWNGIQLWNVSHIEMDGLEILGRPDPEWLAAEPENSPARQTLAGDRRYFGGGITITHNGTEPHFIRIRNNLVHRVGGNGIGVRGGNLILVEGNTVHSSTHRSDAGNSAISFVELNAGLHQSEGYGVVVRNNTLYNNRNMVAFKAVGYLTDGNGIIVDYCQNYHGDRILIANNLAYHNGGRGIHVYFGRNVDIIHNTAYHNLISQDLQWSGELSSDAPGGEINDSIHFHNNIAIARADRRAYNIANTANWEFTRNVTQSPRAPQTPVDGAQNLLDTDPRFVDAAELDFGLQETSPAMDYGLVFSAVPTDLLGIERQGSAPDAGAFEFVQGTFPVTHTVTFAAASGGSLNGELIQEIAAGNPTREVTAVPDEGFVFVHWTWTGGGSSAANPLVLAHVTQDLIVTANFMEVDGAGPAVLVRYTFADVPPIGGQHSSGTFVRQAAAETVAAEITASPFHIQNHDAHHARVIATDSANGIAGAAQIAGIQSPRFQWEEGASANPYYAFTVEGASSLDSLRIVARSGSQWNNTGAFLPYDANRRAEISVRTSLDGYAANLESAFVAGNAGAFREQEIDLSGLLNVEGQAVTFRIYPRAYESSDGWYRAQIGLVEVTGIAGGPPGVDPYRRWAEENKITGTPGEQTGGVPNLLRYALGGTGETPSEAFRLVPLTRGSGMRLNINRIQDPKLVYEVWATDNLRDWGEAPVWSDSGSEAGEVAVDVDAQGPRLFLHLRVRRYP